MTLRDGKHELSATGEYIPEHADHWRIEPFIPIPPSDLSEYLQAHLASESSQVLFRSACQQIGRWVHGQSYDQLDLLQAAYAGLDPDRDTSLLANRDEDEQAKDAAEVTRLMREALLAADYTELSREQLEEACQVSSLWGVPLHVDLDIFQHLGVFARGDVVGVREFRRWQKLYRQELVEVEIYRRLVVLFQVLPDISIDGEGQADRLYLRMFKNIPKADVDMLLPGTQIRFGWLDHTKILVPSLSGIGMTLWKLFRLVLLVAVITTSKLLVLAGLIGATLGYIFRSVTSYFQTKKNYELNLTRSLYFQKLDSNAGVIFRILEESRQQQTREAVLAFYAMLTAGEAIGRRRLKRRCERILRELIEIEVAFEVDDALATLAELRLVKRVDEDTWAVAGHQVDQPV